jgi:hypothetical protein
VTSLQRYTDGVDAEVPSARPPEAAPDDDAFGARWMRWSARGFIRARRRRRVLLVVACAVIGLVVIWTVVVG